MTVITKPLSEKKNDKLDEPLVDNIHTEFPVSKDGDVERAAEGGDPKLFVPRTCFPRPRRASPATTVCLFLTALLVMSFGVLAGVYLYRQFALAQIHRYRGWCRIPYDDPTSSMYQGNNLDQQEASAQLVEDLGMFEKLTKAISSQIYQNQKPKDMPVNGKFFEEQFEIDAEEDSYEKITVPDFAGGKHSRFIHDFNYNKTGIIDLDGHRCFVMPLNRTQVLPPKNLVDLLRKMWSGYYEVDTSVLRETMRVVTPAVRDTSQLGEFIQRDCAGYPTYMLEKYVSGVYKRSVGSEDSLFTVFSGKMTQFEITNLDEVKEYEKNLLGQS